MTVLEALNQGLHQAMARDPRVFFVGEDILDPYGGAFKVARGLSTEYPERVWTTPISEAAIVGAAAGMALRGLRPVVEIMFGDFMTLTDDQVVNHAAKFRWMYNDQVRVPMVIRTPMGGRRGYGPTHSQSLEKLWMGVPGLRVIAPNTVTDPCQLLVDCILSDDDPILFIEHKLLYNMRVLVNEPPTDFRFKTTGEIFPTTHVSIASETPSVLTFACYGYMFELVREAMLELVIEYEIFTDALVYTQPAPVTVDTLVPCVRRSKRLVTVEEGALTMGWGSEISARVAEALPRQSLEIKRVAALDTPIASTRILEDKILPSVSDIVNTAFRLVRGV